MTENDPSNEIRLATPPAVETLNGQKIHRYLELTGILDARKSETDFENWFQKLEYDQFADYLSRINIMMRHQATPTRDINEHEVILYDDEKDEIEFLPPPMSSKDELLSETFRGLKQISDNESRGLLLYYAIQTIHPFKDGNGRTGRLAYEIFAGDEPDLSEHGLSKILDHTTDQAGKNNSETIASHFEQKVPSPNILRYLINREIASTLPGGEMFNDIGRIRYEDEPGQATFDIDTYDQLDPDERLWIKHFVGAEKKDINYPFIGIEAYIVANQAGRTHEFCHVEPGVSASTEPGGIPIVEADKSKNTLVIDGEGLMSSLDASQIRHLSTVHDWLKVMHVRRIIDCFVNSDTHPIDGPASETILEYIKKLGSGE